MEPFLPSTRPARYKMIRIIVRLTKDVNLHLTNIQGISFDGKKELVANVIGDTMNKSKLPIE